MESKPKNKHKNKSFTCLFKGKNCTEKASSKEHLISAKRLNAIKKTNKDSADTNDNIQKTYKHITCEECNNELGIYESASNINLGYATVWKLLAINYSEQNIKNYDLKLKYSTQDAIFELMTTLRECIGNEGVFESHTFVFDFYIGAAIEPKYNQGIHRNSIKIADEDGNPIEGACVYIKTNGFHSGDKGLLTTSNPLGHAEIRMLKNADYLNIFSTPFCVTDHRLGFISETFIEWIIYVILNIDGERILIAMPLLEKNLKQYLFEEIYINTLHEIITNNFQELEIKNLKSFRSLKQ